MKENNLEEIIMEHLKNFFVLIVMTTVTALIYCGLTVIGVLGKIMEWFA